MHPNQVSTPIFFIFVISLGVFGPVLANDPCGGIIDESTGLLVYNYNTPIGKDACLWTFNAKNGSNFGALEFTVLTDGFTAEDNYDHLTFFYIARNGSIVFAGSLKEIGETLIVNSQVVFMSFTHYQTGSSESDATGFIIQFKGVDPTEETENIALRDTGRFYADINDKSINNFSYPKGYTWDMDWDPINEYATFVVHNKNSSSSSTSLRVTVDVGMLLGDCANDALMLYSIRDTGYVFNWPELGTICSPAADWTFTLRPGHSLLAVFRSNNDYQYDDNQFVISWEEVKK